MPHIVQANAISLPYASGVAQCCVSSPPYYGLRDYGVDGQIGLEQSPAAYVANIVAAMREVWRVLRDDGTLWMNLGDSYAGSWGNYGGKNRGSGTQRQIESGSKIRQKSYDGKENWRPPTSFTGNGIKPKDLMGIPWRVAFALQDAGWHLRADIIWAKKNTMPESVTDRPTKSHEYLFLLSKQPRYYYDHVAIMEESTGQAGAAASFKRSTKDHLIPGQGYAQHRLERDDRQDTGQRNARSVWNIATNPYSGAHFATMPPALAEKCILAGTSARGRCPTCGRSWERVVERKPMGKALSERTADKHDQGLVTACGGAMTSPPESRTVGWRPACACSEHDPVPCIVLDPFSGSGTTMRVAAQHRREFIGTELNFDYIGLHHARTQVQVEMIS